MPMIFILTLLFIFTFLVPSHIAKAAIGDLAICIAGFDSNDTLTAPTWPAGWEVLAAFTKTKGTAGVGAEARYYIVVGSEGASFQVDSNNAQRSAHICFHVKGQHPTTPPEAAIVIGDSTTPNPPNLAPSWGSENTLWLAAVIADGGSNFTGDPNGYILPPQLQADSGAGTAGATTRVAYRSVNSASEDPGTFTRTSTGSDQWIGITIGIRPTAGGGATPTIHIVRPRYY